MTEQLLLQVGGMTCTGCESRVAKVLGRLDGVRNTTADHQAGEVRVLFDPEQTSAEAISAAIAGAGYHVSGQGEASR
ncbi:MAG TPA: heavy metal-associated domain-containing protein [Acidimicrobiales bacterium]|nr:heavy metal-associated domain-containing protein [Acidimicrobiales bacterium]